jgi:NitT/TauT family transport system substrate-binding protein
MSRYPADRVPLSRRHFLKSTTLAAGALALPAAPFVARAAAALRPVSMTLDWIYQGPNVGFMLARDKGYYRDAGLDVTVTSGKGSGTTAQLVASKASQFGFSDGYGVATGISKGLPIKTVGSVFRKNPAAMIVLADSGIASPKDLEGKTVAMTAGSGQFQQWPAFAKGAGIDASGRHSSTKRPMPSAATPRVTYQRSKFAPRSRSGFSGTPTTE